MQNTGHEVAKYVRAIKPDAHTVGAVSGTPIDALGFREAVFFVDVGTIGTSVDFKVAESDNASTGFADISGAAITQITGSDKSAVLRIHAERQKRYLAPILTAGGTEDAAVSCVLSNPEEPPVTQSADETVNVSS